MKKNFIYAICLMLYCIFVFCCSFIFFKQINYSFNGMEFVYTGDWIKFLPEIFNLKYFFSWFNCSTLVFFLLKFVSNDYLLSINLTATIIFILCLYLVYLLGSFKGDNVYGCISVFILASLPIVIGYTKYNIYHIQETLYILLATWSYLNSNGLRKRGYCFLYVCSLLMLMVNSGSGFLYGTVLVFLHLLLNKNKKYVFIDYVKCFLWFSFFISIFFIFSDRVFFWNYIVSKIPRWILSKDGIVAFFDYAFYKMPYLIYSRLLSPPYFVLILSLLIADLFLFFKEKELTKKETFVDVFIIVPIGIHLITFDRTLFVDIFCIYPFLALKVSMIIARLSKKLEKLNFIGKWYKFLFGFLLVLYFFYGLILMVPVKEGSFLSLNLKKLKIKSPLYLSAKENKQDVKFNELIGELLADLKEPSVNNNSLGFIFVYPHDRSPLFHVCVEYFQNIFIANDIKYAVSRLKVADVIGIIDTFYEKFGYGETMLFFYDEENKKLCEEVLFGINKKYCVDRIIIKKIIFSLSGDEYSLLLIKVKKVATVSN